MTTAREIMHLGAECIPATETLDRAAQIMQEKQVGSLPICGSDNKLKGILTDRDIVVKCVAAGRDPSKITAGDLAEGEPVWVDAKASEDEILQVMEQHAIRRVPVLEDKKIVGMISEADLAQHLSEQKLAHFVATITQAPPSRAKAPAKATSGRSTRAKSK